MLKLAGIMLQGAAVSLQIFGLTLVFALPLALLVTLGRMSRNIVVSSVFKFYILILRGTPLMLQIIFLYFAPKQLFIFLQKTLTETITSPVFWDGLRAVLSYNRFTAVIIAFVLNYTAYFAEIYRGGIESISRGQYEAAKVLGFTGPQTFLRIILPQVIKRILPATGNEVITLVKDTALARVIGIVELLRVAETAANREFSTMPFLMAGLFYLVMNWLVTMAFAYFEKKLSYYKV